MLSGLDSGHGRGGRSAAPADCTDAAAGGSAGVINASFDAGAECASLADSGARCCISCTGAGAGAGAGAGTGATTAPGLLGANAPPACGAELRSSTVSKLLGPPSSTTAPAPWPWPGGGRCSIGIADMSVDASSERALRGPDADDVFGPERRSELAVVGPGLVGGEGLSSVVSPGDGARGRM